MTFREFIRVLEANGFEVHRQRGSHRVYKGVVGGETRLVVVAGTVSRTRSSGARSPR